MALFRLTREGRGRLFHSVPSGPNLGDGGDYSSYVAAIAPWEPCWINAATAGNATLRTGQVAEAADGGLAHSTLRPQSGWRAKPPWIRAWRPQETVLRADGTARSRPRFFQVTNRSTGQEGVQRTHEILPATCRPWRPVEQAKRSPREANNLLRIRESKRMIRPLVCK